MTRLKFIRLWDAISFGGNGSVTEIYGERNRAETDGIRVRVWDGTEVHTFPFSNVADSIEEAEDTPFKNAAALAASATIDQKMAHNRKK